MAGFLLFGCFDLGVFNIQCIRPEMAKGKVHLKSIINGQKEATCLLLQVLTAPITPMVLRSVSRRALSSSGDSSVAILPS